MFPEEILGGISPYILMLKDVSDHNVEPYLILLNLDTDKVIGLEIQNAAICSSSGGVGSRGLGTLFEQHFR